MEVTFRIRRRNPDVPGKEKPYWQEFVWRDVDPTDRVLEMLHRIKWEQDGSLSLRRSCAHGVCGSDAMRINGVNRLACKMLVRDVGEKIQVEPILGIASCQGPDRRYGALLRSLQASDAFLRQR